ncbi:MAG: site-specific integrase [Deltaproteobacteria bacterium]|nr:site-specific integrase [Deltaproteobacteria bacterium]
MASLPQRTSAYTLKPTEVKALIFNCQNLRERIIIRLMAHCGMRREEVASIRAEKIDWTRNRISFVGKGRLPGVVPMPPDLLQDIKFFLTGRDSGWVFPAKKRMDHITLVQVNRIVTEVGKRAAIKNPNPKSKTGNIHPHLLRHTFARLCKDAGCSIETTQGLMRHASFKTTYDMYGTQDFEAVQEQYERNVLTRL